MRPDANRIALRAVREILAAAQPLELDVAGTLVSCVVTQNVPEPWPTLPLPGIDEAADGPWPGPLTVACKWDGGVCLLEVCGLANPQWGGEVAFAVWLGARERQLLYISLPRKIRDSEDGIAVHIPGDVFLRKRRSADQAAVQHQLSELLSTLVAGSSIPAESKWKARIFDIRIPEGTVEPSPGAALKHAIQLALFKLDFFDRGARAKERGRPLVDIAKLTGLTPKALEAAASAAAPDDHEEEDSEERPRRYWAGGFQWGNESKRDEFIENDYWQIGAPRTATAAPALTTWRRFEDVMPGDLFAIKGLGGEHDLVIHYVGEITSVDRDLGRVTLKRLDAPHFHGKAPRGSGAGNWFDTLVPITRKDVIATIFGGAAATGEAVATSRAYDDIPLNLILFGPPGTGKTYRLQAEYLGRFTRTQKAVREIDATVEVASSLTYFEVLVAALDSMPQKKGSVDQLLAHPLVKAKHQAGAIKNVRQRAWGTLGTHAIEESKTVKLKRRLGELVFDKDADGRWFLAVPLPAELRATIDGATRRKPAPREVKDYDFVTFHQAYSYEDFIEGIRPRVVNETEADDEDEGQVAYALEDGIFKKAVAKALNRMGFEGTIDEFCSLPREERAALATKGPHYAVFIDEINRGNVARVLGELITLLEPDKRLGCENEIIVRLPYSGSLFGVPPNLHVIGTMNTADRSVEALDAALRRRFEFAELAPEPERLDFTIDGPIDPRRMLQTINRRLEKLRDRDHCIGHAYFMPLEEDSSLDALKKVFEVKILPLLQEYFFGDWGKIGLVLGKEFVRRKDDAVELADFDHEDRDILQSRPVYELVPMKDLTDHSFRRIYENVPDDT